MGCLVIREQSQPSDPVQLKGYSLPVDIENIWSAK